MLRIGSEISKTYSESLDSKGSIKNVIQGRDAAQAVPVAGDMLLDHADSMSWILDETSGPAFSLDLLTVLNAATPGEVKFIHIQCHKKIESQGDQNDPIRFTVAIDATTLGKMSQMQLANLDTFVPAALLITAVEVPTGEKAVFTVIFGVDKA